MAFVYVRIFEEHLFAASFGIVPFDGTPSSHILRFADFFNYRCVQRNCEDADSDGNWALSYFFSAWVYCDEISVSGHHPNFLICDVCKVFTLHSGGSHLHLTHLFNQALV
jgi:hypothetical protein